MLMGRRKKLDVPSGYEVSHKNYVFMVIVRKEVESVVKISWGIVLGSRVIKVKEVTINCIKLQVKVKLVRKAINLSVKLRVIDLKVEFRMEK